ncbi:hypothetical protein [Streptomyces syringium]|uniref:hypothetical protein n=1 Tax=Streptomyces syringium TaxID=76729 RepID=UPI003456A841
MVFHQSLVRVRAGTKTDRGGNTVPDWSETDRVTISRVSVQPNLQTEATDPTRTVAVTGWRVLSEPGTDADIRAEDRIEWNGMTLEVQGEVARWAEFQHGGTHHIEFVMTRVTG